MKDILAADSRAAIAVLGDLNDFQFSRTLEILEGAGLANLMKTLPAEEQYSYVFDGNSQVLDQILVSRSLASTRPEYDSVHVNAEFPDQASDHDPQITRLVQPFPLSPGVFLWDAWYRVRCPVLLMRGALSDVLPADVADTMVEIKPQTQLVELPGVGHAPALMSPTEIAVVSAFLREAPGARDAERPGLRSAA